MDINWGIRDIMLNLKPMIVNELICSECGEQFRTFKDLYIHRALHNYCTSGRTSSFSLEDWFLCPLCPRSKKYPSCSRALKAFSKTLQLSRVTNKYVGSDRTETKVFSCYNCPKTFTARRYLKRHMRRHNPDRLKHKCEICQRIFADRCYLRRHTEFRHRRSSQFSCDICSKLFITEISLNIHKKIHSDEDCFKCQLCDRKFSYQNHLNMHFKVFHANGGDGLTCEICSKSFAYRQRLTVHKQTHKTGEIFSCPLCRKTFFCKKYYNNHIRRKHNSKGKQFACDKCPKSFCEKYDLTVHKRTHTEGKSYICPHCNKTFALKKYYTQHITRMHSETPKQFACDKCPKSYSIIYDLNSHKKIHNEDEWSVCPYCQKRFSNKSNCNKHVKRYHKDKSVPIYDEYIEATIKKFQEETGGVLYTDNTI